MEAKAVTTEVGSRYRTLFDAAPDVIYGISADGLFTDLSPAFESLTDWKVEEWIGRSFAEIVHPDDLDRARNRFVHELRGEPLEPDDLRIRTRSGRYLVGEFRAIPNVEAGEVVGVIGIARDVTDRWEAEQRVAEVLAERKRIEDELRSSRDELEAILAGIDEGITAINTEGVIVYANQAAAELSGFTSPGALVGMRPNTGQRFPLAGEPGKVVTWRELPAAKVLRGEPPGEVAITYRLPTTGEERSGRIRAFPVYGEDGAVRLAINIFRELGAGPDDETLRARLAAIVQSVDDAVIGKDLDGIITSWNPGAEHLYGYKPEDVIGKSVTMLVSPEHPTEEFEILSKLKLGERIDALETERVRKDGERIHIRMSVSPIKDSSGNVVGAATIARDITRAKEAEAVRALLFAAEQEARSRAEEGQRRFRFLAEASNILSSSLDYETTLLNIARLITSELADWCVIDVCQEDGDMRRVALAHPDPEREKWAREMERIYPEDPADSGKRIEEIRRSGSQIYEEITDEMIAVGARDEAHLEMLRDLHLGSAMVVPLIGHDRVLGIITMLTAESGKRLTKDDLALAEEVGRRAGMAVENAGLYQQAQQALALRDEFLSIASHELKTPLTSLQLQTQMLNRYVAHGTLGDLSEERQTAILQGVERQIGRLSRLINGLLDVSRISAGKFDLEPEELDLVQVVRDVVDRFGQELRVSGSQVTLTGAERAMGFWDRFRVDQVITNLISNAIKYGKGEPIEINVRVGRKYVSLKVRDRGIGIQQENLEKVFDRFERVALTSSYGGLGLGLYIARQIVEAHGGRIEVESEVGASTTFIVKLPITPPSSLSAS